MSLALCRFTNPFLLQFSVCASIEDDKSLIQSFKDAKIDLDAKDEFDHWYHLLVAVRERKGDRPENLHFHLDAVKSFGAGKSPPDTTIEDLLAKISQFYGRTVRFHLMSEWEIPKAALPRHGIIPAMSGIATTAAGKSLSLTGAQMSFDRPPSPFDEIQWRIAGEKVMVVLDAFEDKEIDDNLLVSAEELVRIGIEKFILEKTATSEAVNG